MSYKIHEAISRYLDSHKREYHTPEFGYASYNPPNTMFSISDSLPELLLGLSSPALIMYLRMLSRLKRSKDPVLACTLLVKHDLFGDLMSGRSFRRAKKELLNIGLIIATEHRDIVIVNVEHANKLYKPKMDIEE